MGNMRLICSIRLLWLRSPVSSNHARYIDKGSDLIVNDSVDLTCYVAPGFTLAGSNDITIGNLQGAGNEPTN